MSKLKDWAMQRQLDLPRIETPLDCLEVGALWLLEQLESAIKSEPDMYCVTCKDLLVQARKLCGKGKS